MKLVPAMELKSFITYIKTIGPGTAVSYKGVIFLWRTVPCVWATHSVGYGDGYLRSLSNKGAVLIRENGQRSLAGYAWTSLWQMSQTSRRQRKATR